MDKIKLLLLFTLSVLMISCEEEKPNIDVSHIKIQLDVARFDKEFHATNSGTIGDLITKYPYLFPGNEPDSIWLARKNDSLAQVLYKEVEEKFTDFAVEKAEITDLFKRVTYHYPSFVAPKVVTLISNLSLEDQIIYADSLLLVSLDTYLGSSNVFYSNYPKYLRNSFEQKQLPVHIAKAIAKELLPKKPYRVFVERIVAHGKLRYAMYEFLPSQSEASLLSYTEQQVQWAQENEESIWQYFVEKEYVYSTDKDLKERFLDPAPFSKFYLTFDNESPGRIGEWLGYQIVKAYMYKYEVSLPELMATTPEEIFNKSKYKPRR